MRSFDAVLEALRANFDPREDFILLPGTIQDTLDFTGSTSAVTVDLSNTGSQDTGAAGHDTLVNIEGLLGSAFNDAQPSKQPDFPKAS